MLTMPTNASERALLHNELHARPAAKIRLPALVTYIAVLNHGVPRQAEQEHLRQLPGHANLADSDFEANFLRLRGQAEDGSPYMLKWERHTEFTRYSLIQSLKPSLPTASDLVPCLASAWLAGIPGRTIVALQLPMLHDDLSDPARLIQQASAWFGSTVVASSMGTREAQQNQQPQSGAPAQPSTAGPMAMPPPAALVPNTATPTTRGHSLAISDFRIQPEGYMRILVYAPQDTSETRAGRIAQRLLELETYRIMALLGLPLAKTLGASLGEKERSLAEITRRMTDANLRDHATDQTLLDELITLAAHIENAMAEHSYRFAATLAYANIARERLAELREKPIYGTQTIGEFLHRRFDPATATIAACERRLRALGERIIRASDLLRTRVDIATEAQNQDLLAKLTQGQALQLRLQSTVEGLSIAAISYYIVSLILYAAKAAKLATWIDWYPELVAGASIPLVLLCVWRLVQHIHSKIHA